LFKYFCIFVQLGIFLIVIFKMDFLTSQNCKIKYFKIVKLLYYFITLLINKLANEYIFEINFRYFIFNYFSFFL